MKKIAVNLSVAESAERLKKSIQEKGFMIFCDIDHQANAKSADLDMPASRVLIFGNPVAGTKLMQKDITMSFDLPIRIAVVEHEGKALVIHQTSDGYCSQYDVDNHPVLDKIEQLFAALLLDLTS